MTRVRRSALVVYSGGKPFAYEEEFEARGFGLRAVPSHKIEITSQAFPAGHRVDRVIFTSRNAVDIFRRGGATFPATARYYAVGASTRAALGKMGLAADAPEDASASSLLAELPESLAGEYVFWPHGDDADLSLVENLKRRGATVFAPVVYRKVKLRFPADLAEPIAARAFSAFACTSAAAARWLFDGRSPAERKALGSVPAAVLGASTAGELKRLGVKKTVSVPDASFDSLSATLIKILQRSKK
ncbi:MAG TPA: uroporphyrinogen-III synthase [Thermoanaerobaculia bacterium]|jgi:uroporphyrinogen-III synthase|nr:uroporphyrinogen-III synthase [Thermoanaerobaculia bacterium]